MKKIITPAVLLALPMTLSAQLVINEINFDPGFDSGDPTVGDANGDGTRNFREDEFVELVNVSGGPLDLQDWTVSDNGGVVHTFGATVLADGQAVVIFGGGTPTGTFGGSVAVAANGDWAGLGNSGDLIVVNDELATEIAFYSYTSGAANDESLVLATELDESSGYIPHSTAAGAAGAPFSPGTRVGGAPFGTGAVLTVSIDPEIFVESAGAAAATGTVTRSGDTSSALTVTLSSDDTSEATVPASVIIPAGQASATFDVDAVDDLDQDSEQTVTISASGTDVFSGTAVITVADNEPPIPTISLSADPSSISENGGTATVTIEISAASPSGYTFDLSSDDTSELTVPASVTIAPNATTATFTATGVDDAETDGTKLVVVSAFDPDEVISEATTSISVTDDENFVAPDIVINEVRIDDPGSDDDEYIELYSATADVSLDLLSIIVIGDGSTGSGTVEDVYPLDGLSFTGNYFVAAASTFTLGPPAPDTTLGGSGIFENSDNISILLVSNFSGSQGDDLDTDDDGMIDVTPWGAILDGVALIEEPNGDDGSGNALQPSGTEWDYSEQLDIPGVGPDGPFVPGHVYRAPDGTGDWQIGPFTSSDGDPDADPPVPPVAAADTPGAENGTVVVPPTEEVLIRSVSIDLVTGEGTLNAINLGTKIWIVETSIDLGVNDPWDPVLGGNGEVDLPDGSTDFTFFFPPASAEPKRFYRLVEAP